MEETTETKVEPTFKNMEDKIPGLEVTWQQAKELEWDDEFVSMIPCNKIAKCNLLGFNHLYHNSGI